MKLISILLFISTSLFAAGVPKLDQLSQSDVNEISKEFAGNFAHTIVAPASSLGKIWGFEFGLLAGATKTPNIGRVTKIYSASTDIKALPTAGFIGALTFPFGINLEANMIPKVHTSDVTFKNNSFALKWEITQLIPTAPLSVALRAHWDASNLSYNSVINNASTGNQNVDATATWKNTVSGFNFELSKKLLFIEPYIGYGRISAKTDIGVTGKSNISIFTFSSASNYQAKNSGGHLYGGLNLNLFIIKVGAEYAQMMGVKKMAAKLSFYF